MRALWVAAVCAACGNDPPFTLKFQLTPGDTQVCTANSGGVRAMTCSDVMMLCDAVVSIRIFPPSAPSEPYISVCKQLTGKKDVCSIAGVDLPQPTEQVPEQRLRVEMAVYPTWELQKDADNNWICPTNVPFASDGFPSEETAPCDMSITDPTDPMYCQPQVAIGGSAMYSPGDPQTVVDLGCTQTSLLTDATKCTGLPQTLVTATVNDFDTAVPVTPTLADRLAVSVGEPKPSGSGYVLNPAETRPLARTVEQPIPGWSANVDLDFVTAACLDVLEDSAQSTSSLTCVQVMPPGTAVDIPGVRLQKATLVEILNALGDPIFPDNGLVIGIVLDDLGNPLPNIAVDGGVGTIDYLTADRSGLVPMTMPQVTSTSGIFVSTDAPFPTMFSALAGLQHVTALGGLVSGKVTIIVLQQSGSG